MSKKRAVIVSPYEDDQELRVRNNQIAKNYLDGLGYEVLDFNSDEVLKELTKSDLSTAFHIGPFVIGATAMLMSRADAVYFERNWEESEYCKDLHLIAFKYGLTMLFAPED